MKRERYENLIAEADRVWLAAQTIDRLRGDTAASNWTAATVRDLIRSRRADDPRMIASLADALEARLARERGVAA